MSFARINTQNGEGEGDGFLVKKKMTDKAFLSLSGKRLFAGNSHSDSTSLESISPLPPLPFSSSSSSSPPRKRQRSKPEPDPEPDLECHCWIRFDGGAKHVKAFAMPAAIFSRIFRQNKLDLGAFVQQSHSPMEWSEVFGRLLQQSVQAVACSGGEAKSLQTLATVGVAVGQFNTICRQHKVQASELHPTYVEILETRGTVVPEWWCTEEDEEDWPQGTPIFRPLSVCLSAAAAASSPGEHE